MFRKRVVDADRIPISPSLPVMDNGQYVWPKNGSRFYTEGDCRTCSRCGTANSTIAPYCVRCRTVLTRSSRQEKIVEEA